MSRAASTNAAGARQSVELADIIRVLGDCSLMRRLSSQQTRVLADIERCRTAALGGHREHCEACDFERFAYNSCRNRHCPKCQSLTKARWLQDRRDELLPVPYFHLVFTLPHQLNDLVLGNKRSLLNLLFNAVSKTLLQFGQTRFGGRVGFTMILHTWDQLLRPHFHLHVLIPAGALAIDGTRWIHGDSSFLFSVRALSKVFRGKFLDGLRTLLRHRELRSPPGDPYRFVDSLRCNPWVVYAKKPFAGPEHTLQYLGRYTHRVAISNDRILELRNGTVTFAYRDRAAGDVPRTMTLPAEQFLRRFLLHVLPHGFMRIRHFGFLANRLKTQALSRCRVLLNVKPRPPSDDHTPEDTVLRITGIEQRRCPRCGHTPLTRTKLQPAATHTCRPPPSALHPS